MASSDKSRAVNLTWHIMHSILNTFTVAAVGIAHLMATVQRFFPVVSNVTWYLLAMFPLLQYSKIIVNAEMLHQDELAGGLKYTR